MLFKKVSKQSLIDMVIDEVLECGECLCKDGKSCAFCVALILKGKHSQWKYEYVKSMGYGLVTKEIK